MKRKRFTESQIIKAIKDQDAGKDVLEICREMGIHKATMYNWIICNELVDFCK
jgi:putative transposase